jgi:hypothetical protein
MVTTRDRWHWLSLAPLSCSPSLVPSPADVLSSSIFQGPQLPIVVCYSGCCCVHCGPRVPPEIPSGNDVKEERQLLRAVSLPTHHRGPAAHAVGVRWSGCRMATDACAATGCQRPRSRASRHTVASTVVVSPWLPSAIPGWLGAAIPVPSGDPASSDAATSATTLAATYARSPV